MEYQHANVDTNAGVARNANDEHNKGNYFNRHDEDLTKQQPHLDDTVMKERPKKKKKRGPYQKIEPQTIIAATTNVMRRGYDVEQASIAAQIKPATLQSAIRRYRKKGSMLPEKRGRKPKGEFTKELKEFVLDYVDCRAPIYTVHSYHTYNGWSIPYSRLSYVRVQDPHIRVVHTHNKEMAHI